MLFEKGKLLISIKTCKIVKAISEVYLILLFFGKRIFNVANKKKIEIQWAEYYTRRRLEFILMYWWRKRKKISGETWFVCNLPINGKKRVITLPTLQFVPTYSLNGWELWSLIYGLFGVSWLIPSSILELLSHWRGVLKKEATRRFLKLFRCV